MNQNCNRQLIDTSLLPVNNSTTRIKRKSSFLHLTHMSSIVANERCCFLLIHVIFYILILTIVFVRLEQFASKQNQFMLNIQTNEKNFTQLKDFQRQLINNNQDNSFVEANSNYLCQTPLPHPKRNRSTRCLQLRVGLNDIIENVFCQNDDYPQWLIIQNRQSNFVDFNRSWFDYRRGFGNVLNQTDFWLGNENLHWLTSNFPCRLKIELTDWYNETRTAIYEIFRVADQKDGYRVHLNGYQGDMEPLNKIDSFSRWHQNARFSTYDHYATTTNCPQKHGGGGWWYHSGSECAHVQLNGRLATHTDGLIPLNTGILWIGWRNDRYHSFQSVQMGIQSKYRSTRFSHRN